MSKKWVAVLVALAILISLFFFSRKEKTDLVNPGSQTNTAVPTPSPTPKSFKFDSTTDLKKELESVNPQVLESDFGE